MNRMPELRDLSDDHHNGLVLARKAKRATADQVAEIWREVERKFQTELAIHFAIEEDHLVEPMRAAGEAPLADQLVEEHRRLRALVAPDAPRTADALEQFGLALEQHIRFEERTFFEIAQQKLSAEALAAVAKACKVRGDI